MVVETTFLETIDSDEKAFVLGFLSYINETHSKYSQNTYELTNICSTDDKELLELLEKVVDIIYDERTETTVMTIINSKILGDIKTNLNKFSDFTDKQKKEFIRGMYEFNYLMTDNTNADITIKRTVQLEGVIDQFATYINVPYIYMRTDEGVEFYLVKYGCSSVDFLGNIYSNINNNHSFTYCNFNNTIPFCGVVKTDENAITPSKTNWSDVGFDLTIIKKVKDFNSKTALYDTGLKIQVDFGYYAEIVPRSSLSKSGYMMANSIGIIDNSYRGNLMVALTKIADDAEELSLPFKCCQLIFKKQVYVNLKEVGGVDKTKRNEGGFGSTGQ